MTREFMTSTRIEDMLFLIWQSDSKMPAGGDLLPPFSIGYCKGWKRAVLALITLQGIRELNLEAEIAHRIKVSCQLMW